VAVAIGLRVFVDVGVVEPDLVLFHAGKGVVDLRFAGAKRFDFRTMQDDAGLKGLQDIVIAPGFGVMQDFGHKQNGNPSRPAGGPRRALASAALFGGGLDLFLAFRGGDKGHFALDDFQQRDVGRAKIIRLINQRTAVAAAGSQLPDPARNEVYQDIGIAHLGQSLLYVFAIQEHARLRLGMPKAITNIKKNQSAHES